MYRLIMVMGMVAITCLGAGCGRSGDGATSSPLTKVQFIERADAICKKAAEEAEVAASSWKEEFPGGPAEAEKHPNDGLRQVLVPSMRREAEALRALEPPTEDKAAVTKLIDNLFRASETLDKEGFKALAQSGALEFKQEAAAYGLKSCGSAP